MYFVMYCSQIVSFDVGSRGSPLVAMLQPTTPLTATLTFIVSQYQHLYIENTNITK